MKTIRFISTLAMLALATVVTAGSMYATASAAALQEAAGFALPEKAGPSSDGLTQNTSFNAIAPVATLAPDQILSDRSETVVLDADGGFSGRLNSLSQQGGEAVPAEAMTVKVLQSGAVVATQQTGVDGEFSFTGLQPGVAGFVAYNANGLMLFGMNLAANTTAAAEPVQIDSAVIEGADAVLAMQMIKAVLANGDSRFAGALTEAEAQFKLGAGGPATTLVRHQVQLQNDGTLHGEINVLDERTGRNREVLDMTVSFLRDGKIVGSSKVANDGKFIVAGLMPGVHSVVGTGKDGALVSAVDILGSTYEAVASNEYSPVSLVQAQNFSGAAVGPANLSGNNLGTVIDGNVPCDVVDPLCVTEVAPLPLDPVAPCCPGGGGGSSGGGGGGGIGGLGLLGLAGLAGLAGWGVSKNKKKKHHDHPVTPSSPGY